ncbi:MAG: hypothetical protein FWC23_07285 [Chitinispirillia bacterium]|nr:hypothetical protein [Chitinispirillia bacterium]MCL2268971.1 hypothetical protein [Chitinispirillia bacterium]
MELNFELPKLPAVADAGDELKLWLAFFNAKTEEDLKNLMVIGGDIMIQAVEAYRSVSASDEFREIERQRDRTRRNEASALANAECRGRTEEKLEVARKMKAKGKPVEEIEEMTGLTVDDILRL